MIEQQPVGEIYWTLEEKTVECDFHAKHSRDSYGRFMVPMLRKSETKQLGVFCRLLASQQITVL